MSVGYGITKHTKQFFNDKGQEVYPPGHPQSGMVKPASEGARDPSLPPKSLAEERMEIVALEAKKKSELDDETRKMVDALASKGIKVSIP